MVTVNENMQDDRVGCYGTRVWKIRSGVDGDGQTTLVQNVHDGDQGWSTGIGSG